MQKSMCCIVVAGLFLMAISMSAVWAESSDKDYAFGHVLYPALGNIRLDEGTVEAWVVIHFDPYEPTILPYYLRAVFFELFLVANKRLGISWLIKPSRYDKSGVDSQLWASSFGVDHGAAKLGTPSTIKWKTGQLFHMAVTWESKHDPIAKLFIDGKEIHSVLSKDKRERLEDMDWVFPDNAVICIGNRWNTVGLFTMDELRVSSVARRPEELGFFSEGPLQPDRFTLLLDNFDECGKNQSGKLETHAGMMARVEGRTGGIMAGGCRLVDGKYGKGMALFTPRDGGESGDWKISH